MNAFDNSSNSSDPSDSASPQLTPRQKVFVDSLLEHMPRPSADNAELHACPLDANGDKTLARALATMRRVDLDQVPHDLLARTMARITHLNNTRPQDEVHNIRKGRFYFMPEHRSRPRQWINWNRQKIDFAVMLVAASLIMVVLVLVIGKARQRAARTLCANNLVHIAAGIGEYAAANGDLLPSVAMGKNVSWLPENTTAILPTSSIARDGNAANLSPLMNGHTKFVSWKNLICPTCMQSTTGTDRHLRKISYSYIDELGPWHHHFNGAGNVVILADANPLFAGREVTSANMNSFNHRSTGENILCDNGTVRWVASPLVGPQRDNIYTIQTVETTAYTGYEEPDSPHDVFLVP